MQEDWDDLRLVLALARGGGVSAAATALGLDPTTVTRRLARAERRAGAALIARTAQGLRPTEAGRALMQAAERAEAAIQGAQATLGQARGGRTDERAGRGASGHVRLTAVPILANRVIVPALPAHLAAHPQLRVELVAEPRNLAVMERETDIALRLARPERELAAKARRIGRLGYAVYAAAGRDPAALPWIGYGGAMAALPQARWIEDRAGGRASLPLRVQDAETLLQAVLAGLGKSVLPVLVADRWAVNAPAAPLVGPVAAPGFSPVAAPIAPPAGKQPPHPSPGTPPATPSGTVPHPRPGTSHLPSRDDGSEIPNPHADPDLPELPDLPPRLDRGDTYGPAETPRPRLVRLPGAAPPEREIWMITHPTLGQLPSVSVTASWLSRLFAA